MKQTGIIITALLCLTISGCAIGPRPFKRFVSPAQAAYDQAETYFQQKDYSAAIAAYEKFIKNYPSHKLTPGAYLGMAWSHYLKGEYKETLEPLSLVRTQKKELKAWIDKLAEDTKKRIAKAGEATSPSLFNIPAFTNQERLKIDGIVPEGGRVLINKQEAKISGGVFSQEVILQEGENLISVDITDKEGKTETKELKVTLDKTPPILKVNSTELDDYGYVQISGETKKGAKVSAEDQQLLVDAEGKFSGQVKLPYNKQLQLQAEDQAGNITKEIFYDTEVPDRPRSLRIRSIYASNVDLAWNRNTEQDIKGYNVYYSVAGEFSDLKYNSEIIKNTEYTLTGLKPAKTYDIYIRAVDKMGNESQPSIETVRAAIP